MFSEMNVSNSPAILELKCICISCNAVEMQKEGAGISCGKRECDAME